MHTDAPITPRTHSPWLVVTKLSTNEHLARSLSHTHTVCTCTKLSTNKPLSLCVTLSYAVCACNKLSIFAARVPFWEQGGGGGGGSNLLLNSTISVGHTKVKSSG
jgi:hypothetical protein